MIDKVEAGLRAKPRRWLVTGAAGFIGSHLTERLLQLGQQVTALDNLSTGFLKNIELVRQRVGAAAAANLRFIEGDVRDGASCRTACEGVERVLHQGALGSVPRSIEDPIKAHASNVDGFVQIMDAARVAKVARFVYASSSSVYGDDLRLPKREGEEGRVLSPYAVTKLVNEHYARTWEKVYGLQTAGLRYFNVFGPRQDPNGAYAAVVPRWIDALSRGQNCEIYGDGETSRDFCFVANVVQANLLAAMVDGEGVSDTAYNIAVGGKTSLTQLFFAIRDQVAASRPAVKDFKPAYKPFRAGDILHSQADISRAQTRLGYAPTHDIHQGLRETVKFFIETTSP